MVLSDSLSQKDYIRILLVANLAFSSIFVKMRFSGCFQKLTTPEKMGQI